MSFGTALSIDGMPTAVDLMVLTMASGEWLNRCFGITWQCSPLSDTIRVLADMEDGVVESDETNNTLEEDWWCDTTPPTITSGPSVSSITQTSGTVSWTTDESSLAHRQDVRQDRPHQRSYGTGRCLDVLHNQSKLVGRSGQQLGNQRQCDKESSNLKNPVSV
jgi:hypothetical protein